MSREYIFTFLFENAKVLNVILNLFNIIYF